MSSLKMGIDIGSTTAKVAILDQDANLIFSAYQRHSAEILETIYALTQEALTLIGDQTVSLVMTGSAGLGVSEKFNLPFIQEVVASAEVVRQLYPNVNTLIDIGGEDAKMIFFDEAGRPDIRMNGSCAGGTGAFIDEMAALLNISITDLDQLAQAHTRIYPIASRCGVFAKTDLQNLLSREIPRPDIAASIFNAIVLQTLATLSRGCDPASLLLFCGGPLTFLPALKEAFIRVLDLKPDEVLEAQNTELLPAIGAALAENAARREFYLGELISFLSAPIGEPIVVQNRLQPLFEDRPAYATWSGNRSQMRVPRIDIQQLAGESCFLGVDSGSTTTKVVLIDKAGRVAFEDYRNNHGNAIQAVQYGLQNIGQSFAALENPPRITRSVVTGYGEDLVRAAFDFDEGMVETLAHYRAATTLDENVSFILDIGGQDMKAIFVDKGKIQNIEINEACSSGCGSFIESFAHSLGYPVAAFAEEACRAQAPCDLGTRCTVFMNSKVKQALREGAEVSDISAGLAYSVIKNALHKVLKVTNTADLGEHIVVQGGTFRNQAILKATEIILGRKVVCPDIAELMGAYGAALTARDVCRENNQTHNQVLDLNVLADVKNYITKQINCRGCENCCAVTKLVFPNQNVFYTGNRCERIYTNRGEKCRQGKSLTTFKQERLFSRAVELEEMPLLTVGIPRVLNIYENYPFWHMLFTACGIQVELSGDSSKAIYDKGAATIMSENICYPAKMVHGHIFDLIEARVDRIFYPMVFYEESGFTDAANCYVCPILSGYPDVVRSAIAPEEQHGIPLDTPAINFKDQTLLKKACFRYLAGLGVQPRVYKRAFARAAAAQREYREAVVFAGGEMLAQAREAGRPTVLLMGRPYHIDDQINHQIPDILTNFGVDVITEDAVPRGPEQALDNKHALTQWEYTNRLYHAARWACEQDDVEVVQLNSFGCGPDAFAIDEIRAILGEFGKSATVIRIDEIESAGSTRLRLRSMLDATTQKHGAAAGGFQPRKSTRPYGENDRGKALLVPQFANFCTAPLTRPVSDLGSPIILLPKSDRSSVNTGLKYANNEICYPGTIVIGDVINALQSGEYDLSEVAVGLWETGGQCRASCIFTACKKAMISAGYEEVPLITVSTSGVSINEQPGFQLDPRQYIYKAAVGGDLHRCACDDVFPNRYPGNTVGGGRPYSE